MPQTFNKKLIILYITIFVFIICLVIAFLISHFSSNTPIGTTPTSFPSVTPPTTQPQQAFNVITTIPSANAQNVQTGEIIISVSTDADIVSAKSIQFVLSPNVTNYFFENTFPSRELKMHLVGGLQPSTTYSASINSQNKKVYSWSFTTQQTPGPNSSQQFKQYEQNYNQTKYPLLNYLPVTTNDFIMDYDGELSLSVKVTNTSLTLTDAEKEVDDWIRNHGVDPSTHKVTYYDNSLQVIGTQ